jgi:DNA-binding LytR/AlgR family response regulator
MSLNCIVIDDDKLSRKVLEEFVARTDFLNLTHSLSNAIEAINLFNEKADIDLIFLDIEMPEMSGIEFLGSLDEAPEVIIVSSKEKYALESYEYDVTDYLLKPVSYGRFFKAADKVRHKLLQKDSIENKGNEEIFIKKNSSLVKLKFDEILWIEAMENYVVIHTFDDKFTIHFTMKAIGEKLPPKEFIRVHRSFIINLKKVDLIEDNTIIMKTSSGSKLIPIGKSYKDNLMDDINLISK